tara:strand:- start:7700 stop:8182 length:483 start_codon:yes stop_codon:yes gene_type:complete
MATTVNNTTANSRITIIFDASINREAPTNGPRDGSGNTEADVYIDDVLYENVRCHSEINADVHALQWNATTNTGHIEFVDNRENESITSFPQWASNVVIRVEADNEWKTAWDASVATQTFELIGNEVDKDHITVEQVKPRADTEADKAREDYLKSHSITY